MTTEAKANISTRREVCRRECRQTWRHSHGGAVPGGPFPGTHAVSGDVRRCEHGKFWSYCPELRRGDLTFDWWERLDWFTPIKLWRAKRALARDEASSPA